MGWGLCLRAQISLVTFILQRTQDSEDVQCAKKNVVRSREIALLDLVQMLKANLSSLCACAHLHRPGWCIALKSTNIHCMEPLISPLYVSHANVTPSSEPQYFSTIGLIREHEKFWWHMMSHLTPHFSVSLLSQSLQDKKFDFIIRFQTCTSLIVWHFVPHDDMRASPPFCIQLIPHISISDILNYWLYQTVENSLWIFRAIVWDWCTRISNFRIAEHLLYRTFATSMSRNWIFLNENSRRPIFRTWRGPRNSAKNRTVWQNARAAAAFCTQQSLLSMVQQAWFGKRTPPHMMTIQENER